MNEKINDMNWLYDKKRNITSLKSKKECLLLTFFPLQIFILVTIPIKYLFFFIALSVLIFGGSLVNINSKICELNIEMDQWQQQNLKTDK